jgi:hypothetical protein
MDEDLVTVLYQLWDGEARLRSRDLVSEPSHGQIWNLAISPVRDLAQDFLSACHRDKTMCMFFSSYLQPTLVHGILSLSTHWK